MVAVPSGVLRTVPTLAIFCLLMAGCSQPPAGTEGGPSEPGRGTIEGVIVDAAIRPLVGATIAVAGMDLKAATDARGAFSFASLEPGSYLLQANATGYLDGQATVLVQAGKSTRVTINLLKESRTEPYVLTKDFQGFAQLSGGILTPVIDSVAKEAGVATCSQCTFKVSPEAGLSRMVLEVSWRDSIADPTGATEYIWRVTADSHGATATGSGKSPIFRSLGILDFPAEDFDFSSSSTYTVTIYPDATWPAVSQSYKAFLSMWYRGPPPADWRIIPH
jgi:hypothetical protein